MYLHVAQLMPLPLTVSCFSKSRLVLLFWYRLTGIVPEKGRETVYFIIYFFIHNVVGYFLRVNMCACHVYSIINLLTYLFPPVKLSYFLMCSYNVCRKQIESPVLRLKL